MIESMNGGAFLSMNSSDAWQFLETLFENSQQWDFSNERGKSRKGGLYEVRDDMDVKSVLGNLTKKVEALALSQTMNSAMSVRNDTCSSYANPSSTFQESYAEQANALNFYWKSSDSPFSATYNPNWRNHPNFSWRPHQSPIGQGGQQFVHPNMSHPPGFQSIPQNAAPQQRRSSLEDTLQQFMQSTQQAILKLETQVGQLATVVGEREKGKLPSQPIPNPKGQFEVGSNSDRGHEEVKSITTLRSGREIDNHVKIPENRKSRIEQDIDSGKVDELAHDKSKSQKPKEDDHSKPYSPRAPFPQRLVPYNDVLEVFKQVRIN